MLKVVRVVVSCMIFGAVTGCTTAKKSTSKESTAPMHSRDEGGPSIDYNALQTYLQLDRDPETLGFTEKSFNTCDAGFGYSRSQNCHKEYFVVLHFRLLCRDSEGTISTVLTESDVTPIAGRPVKWQLKGVAGTTMTDGNGYGQIRTVASSSQNRQRLKLTVGNEFLYMRSNEITKVITPRPWCSQ
ncbi:hypothetical protein [Bdellovibrio svalbardensis]|uniref:Lipoprotein n=1 Tax=Bdellovibrio svalbardensis TaxID=2972972 RepID=A0ABT6DNC5_9BACT|nr:hypothetical protein [Bdellovibrio svalbardensis]MDG0818124.1 hypothetical protein [Bdellovibrio svalbardensis]